MASVRRGSGRPLGVIQLLIVGWAAGCASSASDPVQHSSPREPSLDSDRDAGFLSDASTRADAGSDAGISERSACRRYVEAWCQRNAACGLLRLDACLELQRSCPESLLAPGSARTARSLIECAPRFADLDCGSIQQGRVPCEEPGELPLGAVCGFASQCNSLSCHKQNPNDPCGVCGVPLALGESCETSSQCQGAYVCEDVCGIAAPSARPLGEPCHNNFQCDVGLFCEEQQGTRRCAALPEAGQDCRESRLCAAGLSCGPGNLCAPTPVAGESCAFGLPVCQQDAVCDPEGSALCVPRDGRGAPCRTSTSLSQGSCEAGLVCLCETDDCDTGRCVELREEDQACEEPDVVCVEKTQCQEGTCVALGVASACVEGP